MIRVKDGRSLFSIIVRCFINNDLILGNCWIPGLNAERSIDQSHPTKNLSIESVEHYHGNSNTSGVSIMK